MRAAIYTRISNDHASDRLGVSRQEQDCRLLCQRRGWEVVAIFEDDDRSAFAGKPRPGYLKMLERLQLGDVRAIVAWHPDRLHRSPLELEDFIDLIDRTGATVATVQGGDYDLSMASGRMTARVVGAVARHESEHKSERLRRKMEELVAAGRITGGVGNRPFGYEKDQMTIRPAEADIVREVAERILAGEAVKAVANDLNRREVPTVQKGPWLTSTLRTMLKSPRIAGLRELHGQVSPAPWPAIIDVDRHKRLVALFRANAEIHQRAPRRYLLTSIVRCGRDGCGAPMVGRPVSGVAKYACVADRGGCNRTFVNAGAVDSLVADAVFDIVDSPDFAMRLRRMDGRSPELHDEMERIEQRMKELAEAWADGEISRSEWQAARARLQDTLTELRRRHSTAARDSVLDAWEDRSLRDAWPNLTLAQQRAIVTAVISRIVIAAAGRQGMGHFDSRRVTIERRL
jgi:site-specific DNA recombinase